MDRTGRFARCAGSDGYINVRFRIRNDSGMAKHVHKA